MLIIRADSTKAASVVASLRGQLLNHIIQVINHNNIAQNHLQVKGVHLKENVVGRLILNFLQTIRSF